MRPLQALLGALLVCGGLSEILLTKEELRSSAFPGTNPILSRLRDFEIVRPAVEGPLVSALTDSDEPSLPASLDYSLAAFGRSFKLQLRKNDALLSPSYQEMRIDFSEPKGKEVPVPSHSHSRANCYYIGSVDDEKDSVVAVNLCGGVRGIFKTKEETYNIEPVVLPSSSASVLSFSSSPLSGALIDHIVFRDSDIQTEEGEEEEAGKPWRCGVHDDDEMAEVIREELRNTAVSEPQPVVDEYTIELLAVNDYARYRSKGDSVEEDTLQLANIASAYYARTQFVRPLKMVLVGQVTFLNNDPYPARQGASGVEVEGRTGLLRTFNRWRQENKDRLPAHDSGQLLSGLTFTSGIRGLAPVGAMCSTQSGSICQLTSPSQRLNAMIMAHETGHTLSMLHDTMGNSCSMGNVMQPTVSEADAFSSCSIQYANRFLTKQPGPTCLHNKAGLHPPVFSRWESEEVQTREADVRASGTSGASDIDIIAEHWPAFVVGAVAGSVVTAALGVIIYGVAARCRTNGRRKRQALAPLGPSSSSSGGLPASSSLTSVSRADFWPIAHSGSAESFPEATSTRDLAAMKV